jgi:CrcB protein
MMIWFAIALGGALGAAVRHGVNVAVHVRYATSFPVGIFVVNATGCLVIGLLAGLLASTRMHMSEVSRAFLFVGVLGGFTTFSSFALDSLTLMRGGHVAAAMGNAIGQLVVGLVAVWVGYALGAWRS